MIPVHLDDRQARFGALTLPLERIQLRLLWRFSEDGQETGGHAYAIDNAGRLEIICLEHGVFDQSGMLELLKTVDRCLDTDRAHGWIDWRPPDDDTTSLYGDLGMLGEILRGRRMRVLDAATGHLPTTWRLPQESFLRGPVAAWARHLLGVSWPERWEAQVLRGRFQGARHGDHLVFTGCRYGSLHDDSGQDRTAAIFFSEDSGGSWRELSWRLNPRQTRTPAGRWCWPPEELLSVRVDPFLMIEWDDPWIPWEPGNEWLAIWGEDQHLRPDRLTVFADPSSSGSQPPCWTMKRRTGIEAWLRYWFGRKH